MLSVTITGSGDTLDLDEISLYGEGVQAITGLVGLGLPPVSVQWFEGAGDGAQARNIRVEPRDVDIPLHVVAADRDSLKAIVRRIGMVMAGEMLVKIWEDGVVTHQAVMVRTGGGTYIYGSDTIGENEWNSIVTLRAGDPYWNSPAPRGAALRAASDTALTTHHTIKNAGSVFTFPTWTIAGPLGSVEIRRTSQPNGAGTVLERFTWTGNLNQGDVLTIDTRSGSVKDQTGANRYAGLSIAPDLFRLPPGDSYVSITNTAALVVGRRNYASNPSFESGNHDWTPTTGARIRSGTSVLEVKDWAANPRYPNKAGKYLSVGKRSTYNNGSPDRMSGSKTFTGLPVGQSFQVRFELHAPEGQQQVPIQCYTEIAGQRTLYTLSSWPGVLDFVVPADGSITIGAIESMNPDMGIGYFPAGIDNIYVGPPGVYFDGSTPDTAETDYAWVGAVNASQSTLSVKSTKYPTASVAWTERDWMVV